MLVKTSDVIKLLSHYEHLMFNDHGVNRFYEGTPWSMTKDKWFIGEAIDGLVRLENSGKREF